MFCARRLHQAASTSATAGRNANRIIWYNLINGAVLLEVKGDGEKFSDLQENFTQGVGSLAVASSKNRVT